MNTGLGRVCMGQVGMARAFTLVELLVVVSIISVLAALLLPVLEEAIEQGRTIQCGNNIRQVYIGFAAYGQDHDDQIPYSHSEPDLGPWGEMPYAPLFQLEYLPGSEVVISWAGNPVPIWQAPFMLCPSALSAKPIWGGGELETGLSLNGVTGLVSTNTEALARLISGLSYSGDTRGTISHYGVCEGSWSAGWDGPFSRYRPDRWRAMHKFSWVKHPTRCWLIGDGADSGMRNACFRHNRRTDVVHVDGHVELFAIGQLRAKAHSGRLYIDDSRLRMLKWNSDPGL